MMKEAFYFTSKALSFLRYLNFYVEFSQKDKLNFKICDVATWLTSTRSTYTY